MLLRYLLIRFFPPLLFLLVFFDHSAIHAQGASEFPEELQQVTDTLFLEEILIQSTRIREPLHYQPVEVRHIDAARLAQYDTRSIATVLSHHSGLFIRDNGPGGMATLSQRGLGPTQTEVLWEGFPVNSLSLGLADLSLIPAGLFESVEVSSGTPSSSFGGGSLGGTVWLSSHRPDENNRISLMQSAGAFNTRNSRVHAEFDSESWNASFGGIYNTAENNFSYYNRATGQFDQRDHNAGSSGHLMGSAGYRFTNGRVYTSLWYLDSDQQIPGSVLTGSTQAEQSNRVFRWLAGAEAGLGRWKMDIRGFLERDRMQYLDPAIDLDSRFQLDRGLMEVDFRRPSTGMIVWQGGISGGQEWAETGNYADERQRRILGLRLNPEIRLPAWNLRFSPAMRLDSYTGFGRVLSPSFGANWEVYEDHLFLRGMVSRDFNPPTFNDLYWAPGGNPDLKPERSFRTEGGFIWQPGLPLIEEIRLTGYRIGLEQGIYWFPQSGDIWSPDNVEEVDARGLEAGLVLAYQTGRFGLRWDSGMDRRKSEIAKERFPGDGAVGRQMRYVPGWTVRSNLDLSMAPFMVNVNYRWTGQRYVTEDHTHALDPFQVLDLTAAVERTYRGLDGYMRVAVNNILNEQYEVIQWYPMPGRHIEFALGLGIPM